MRSIQQVFCVFKLERFVSRFCEKKGGGAPVGRKMSMARKLIDANESIQEGVESLRVCDSSSVCVCASTEPDCICQSDYDSSKT